MLGGDKQFDLFHLVLVLKTGPALKNESIINIDDSLRDWFSKQNRKFNNSFISFDRRQKSDC